MGQTLPLTRRAVLAQAWPIVVGQASVPLVGLVDTAVIGRTGDAAALAAVALGGTIVNFALWTFGFLRMGMTGLTAQAQGAGDHRETAALVVRGLLLGLGCGAAILGVQAMLVPAALRLMAGNEALDASAHAYIEARLYGAPAALAVYAVVGWLFGLGRTRAALAIQLVLNIVNVALCALYVWHLGWGVRGVGLATATADWLSLILALAIAAPALRGWRDPHLLDRAALKRLFAVNGDIMIRTIALLVMLTWFANAGARLGAERLAAQQVLMQFVATAAFVLDGFCFTAESRVGQAIGAGSRAAVDRAIRLTGEFALATGAGFALLILLAGGQGIALLTTNPAVRALARDGLAYVALIPLIGVPAWMLDGIFIGATAGRALRDAAILATGLYIATDLALRPLGSDGVWLAFIAAYVWRALALGWRLPGLLAKVGPAA
jgi:MATE family multidrug resistance protein